MIFCAAIGDKVWHIGHVDYFGALHTLCGSGLPGREEVRYPEHYPLVKETCRACRRRSASAIERAKKGSIANDDMPRCRSCERSIAATVKRCAGKEAQ